MITLNPYLSLPPGATNPWPMGDMLESARRWLASEPAELDILIAPDRCGETAPATDPFQVTATLLDGFHLRLGGREINDLPRGKTRAILKYLLLHHRRAIPRARLTRLFWPEADPAAARNSLNVTLHRARKVLGQPGLLVYSNDAYQLSPSAQLWTDVEQFLMHAEAGRLAQLQQHPQEAARHYIAAADLYRTDLVEEGDDEPVLHTEAQALQNRLTQVLQQLSALHESLGEHHACIQATLRLLQLDACNEGAHQMLMRCYARLDQPQLAERQYRHCVQTLRDTLGVPPLEETRQLYRRIAARQLERATATAK